MAGDQLVVDQPLGGEQGPVLEVGAVVAVLAARVDSGRKLVDAEGHRGFRGRVEATDAVGRLRQRLEVVGDAGLDLLDVAHVAFLDLLGRLGDEARVGPDLVQELLHCRLLGGGLEADLLAQRRQLRFETRHFVETELVDLLRREIGSGVHPNAVDVELAAAGHRPEPYPVGRRLQVVVAE